MVDEEAIKASIIRLQEDVAEIRGWMASHRSEHTADTRLLASIIDQLDIHQENHHGRSSMFRQASWITACTAVLLATAEVVRYLVGL